MSSIPKLKFLITHKVFYESLEHYVPDRRSLLEPVQELLPSDWEVLRKGVWFHAEPPQKALPLQGWKIHLSATEQNAVPMLRQVVPVLVGRNVAFKFAVDQRMLSLMTSKGWDRGSSGKFITIYPDNERQFVDLIDELHHATVSLFGPRILSDRRYRDSKVVYYRYGGIAPVEVLAANGEKKLIISAPDGRAIWDERQPRFVLPEWVKDPFEGQMDLSAKEDPDTLKNGRYAIRSTLTISNSGAVYLATDNDGGAMVIVKEARPFINIASDGADAVAMLRKEYRLLRHLEPARIAPRPIDLFAEGERSYLVEEYLPDAVSLRFYSHSKLVVLFAHPAPEKVKELWSDYRRLFIEIARLMQVVHQYGIVLMDFSNNNILLANHGQTIRFIDFEAAVEAGTDTPTHLLTPGFASMKDLEKKAAGVENDYYSLGAVMLSSIIPINAMMDLDPQVHIRFLRSVAADYGLPSTLCPLIGRLFNSDPELRPKPAEVIAVLERSGTDSPALHHTNDVSNNGLSETCMHAAQEIVRYVLKAASYNRTDRLFPADPKVFVTGPLNVAYGACGVAWAVNAITGDLPQSISDWILQQKVDEKLYPPGLYLGSAGIAWTLKSLGFHERAEELARSTWHHPGLGESWDIFHGLAGWGMGQLKFFLETGDEAYLQQAVLAGKKLADSARTENGCLYWPQSNGAVVIGFAHGSSGISVFLLYLYLVTGDEQFLDLGKKALDFDTAACISNSEGDRSWPIRRSPDAPGLPYFRYGTAGVGMATVRYYRALGEARYEALLGEMLPDVNRKYAIYPGRFIGLAGIAEFLLDLRELDRFHAIASAALQRVISGIMLFKMEGEDGVAFPGYELYRVSCDFGTGSAGIGALLHRYVSGQRSAFFLDELLCELKSASKARESPAEEAHDECARQTVA